MLTPALISVIVTLIVIGFAALFDRLDPDGWHDKTNHPCCGHHCGDHLAPANIQSAWSFRLPPRATLGRLWRRIISPTRGQVSDRSSSSTSAIFAAACMGVHKLVMDSRSSLLTPVRHSTSQ